MGGQPSKSSPAAARDKDMLAMGMPEESDCTATGSGDEKGGRHRLCRRPEALALETVAALPASMLQDPKNRLAMCALSSANPAKVLTSPSAQTADQQVFNIKIPFEGGPITNQRASGRCWLFASTNIFRIALMHKYRLESFELSQAYLFYWDKLEKANWFLEQIIDTAGEDLDGRLVQTLLSSGGLASDGGQWDMVCNLVDKYGLVPHALYPDSWNASNSNALNAIVRNKLRESALQLRSMARDPAQAAPAVLSAHKARMVREVQQLMTLLLGPPPNPTKALTWQYNDRDGKAHELAVTPKQFAHDISSAELRISAAAIGGMMSLVHDPRHAPLSLLVIARLGNVVGGRGVRYINVAMDTLKAACVKMLQAGLPVFFGCDVSKFSDSASGIMDTAMFDYHVGLGTDLLGMTKAQRLRAGESQMTHAMVLTAVHVDEQTGRPVRWRVQNSWGPASGDKGWFLMSDKWMDEFAYQAVVDPRFCSKEVRHVLNKEPIVLPPWDPIGSMA